MLIQEQGDTYRRWGRKSQTTRSADVLLELSVRCDSKGPVSGSGGKKGTISGAVTTKHIKFASGVRTVKKMVVDQYTNINRHNQTSYERA